MTETKSLPIVTQASSKRRGGGVAWGIDDNRKTFLELYCDLHRIDPDDFSRIVFRRALYPHVRPWTLLIMLFNRQHFTADYDFINGAAHITHYREFSLLAEEFARHPLNRGFPRRVLRLRLSTHRLRTVIKTVLPRKSTAEAGRPG